MTPWLPLACSFHTRHHRNHSTVQSTEARIFWYSILECVAILGLTFSQVWILKTFFSRTGRYVKLPEHVARQLTFAWLFLLAFQASQSVVGRSTTIMSSTVIPDISIFLALIKLLSRRSSEDAPRRHLSTMSALLACFLHIYSRILPLQIPRNLYPSDTGKSRKLGQHPYSACR